MCVSALSTLSMVSSYNRGLTTQACETRVPGTHSEENVRSPNFTPLRSELSTIMCASAMPVRVAALAPRPRRARRSLRRVRDPRTPTVRKAQGRWATLAGI
jgi:hypothetical protein